MDWWRVWRLVGAGLAVMVGVALGGLMVVDGEVTLAGPLSPSAAAGVARQAGGAVVEIQGVGCGGPIGGSGFAVSGAVFSAAHLLSSADGAFVVGVPPGHAHYRAVIGRRSEADLALLGASPGPTLALAAVDAPAGSSVVLVGRVGGQLVWRAARVHQYTTGGPYGVDGVVMLVDPAGERGWSGGPVLDGRGRVVGMVRALDVTTGLGLAVPVSELHSWLSGDVNGADSTSCDN